MKDAGLSKLMMGYVVASQLVIPSIIFLVSRSKGRVPGEFKLLRGPGESLRRRMEEFREKLLLYLIGCTALPFLTTVVIVVVWAHVAPHTPVKVAWPILSVLAVSGLITAAVWLGKKARRFSCDRLGYLGERAVGERLQALPPAFRVFHDVPVQGTSKKFNLDHVVVGPTGVCLIEVKTRRKRKGLRGKPDYRVSYDGNVLHWPWKDDRMPKAKDKIIDQIRAEYDWLKDWLRDKSKVRAEIQPIIVLPGWYVKSDLRLPLKVVNEKAVSRIVRYGREVLSEEQISRIAEKLDEACRDVAQ